MGELVFRKTPAELIFLLILAISFVSVPFFVAAKTSLPNQMVLWVGAVFFGLCTVQMLRTLFSSRPAMKFS